MFAEFLRRLTDPAPQSEPLADDDARLALAALLVRLARSDGSYEKIEVTRIQSALARRYGLTPDAADALLRAAETIEATAPDTVRFTRAIKSAVALEARLEVMEILWEIVLADGRRDADEDALMRMIAALLGISDRDSALARQKTQGKS